MGKIVNDAQGNRSQSAQLRRLVKQALVSVVIGGALLVGFLLFNIITSRNLQP